MDRLRLLETFIRIVERGSISAAARDLDLSQASASRQLAQLEDRLGDTLVVRSTHALALTEAGERLLPDARALVAGWDALDDKADANGPLTGSVRAVVPIALGQTILLPALVRFQQSHPDLSVTWRLEDGDIRFAEEGCDLWIKVGRPRDENLISRIVAEVERIVVAAPALPPAATPDALSQRPCLSLGPFEGTRLRLHGPDGKDIRLELSARLATNDIRVTHAAAREGLGFAVLPRWLAASDLSEGRLVDYLPGWTAPRLSITLNYAPASRTLRRMVALRDALETALRAGLSAS
ncbi:MAG: LysR family transcriptional regulator [Pseudomonadota bacterium]